MHKSDYVGREKFLHGFIKNGLAKVRLNLQMDKNFFKNQYLTSASTECKNAPLVIHCFFHQFLQ